MMLGTREPGLGVDNFGRAKVYNLHESIARELCMVLLNKPGFMPSQPTLGMNIQELLYTFYDEISEKDIGLELGRQCPVFSDYINSGVFTCRKRVIDGYNYISFFMKVNIDEVAYRLVFNFHNMPNGEVVYDFYFDENDDSEKYAKQKYYMKTR